MIRLAICEDDPQTQAQIQAFADRLLQTYPAPSHVMTYSGARDLLDAFPDALDVLLMDIDLGDGNGIDVARKIRRSHPDLPIIFITNLPQFAVSGYKVRAFGYLLKPLQYEDFCAELSELLDQLNHLNTQRLQIKADGQHLSLPLKDIYHIETDGRRLKVMTTRGTFSAQTTLSKLEKQLSEQGFVRCHTGFLVNAAHICQFKRTELILSNGAVIPVSKHRRAHCLAQLNRYWGQSW